MAVEDSKKDVELEIPIWLRWTIGSVGFGFLAFDIYVMVMKQSDTVISLSMAVGAFCLILALSGNWPKNISLGQMQIQLRELTSKEKETAEFTNLISPLIEQQVAKFIVSMDLLDQQTVNSKIAKLTKQGGSIPFPVIEYDERFFQALQMNSGKLKLNSSRQNPGIRADFLATYGKNEPLYIETKFLDDDSDSFAGASLDPLLKRLEPNERLLVVANVKDIQRARKKVQDYLGQSRGEVISWIDGHDTEVLRKALKKFFPSAGL